jgi:hypothetical protein
MANGSSEGGLIGRHAWCRQPSTLTGNFRSAIDRAVFDFFRFCLSFSFLEQSAELLQPSTQQAGNTVLGPAHVLRDLGDGPVVKVLQQHRRPFVFK